jgi:hypothetical protein
MTGLSRSALCKPIQGVPQLIKINATYFRRKKSKVMTATNDEHSALDQIHSSPQEPAEMPLSQDEHQGVSRRSLLKGAAVAGVSLASVGGLAIATQKSEAQAASRGIQVQTSSKGRLREYWVQVDSYLHNLVPTGYDGLMGMHYKPKDSSFWALGYRAYTPGWGKPLAGNNDIGTNNGIPGPVFRGEVGDTIRVHFRNNDTHYRYPHSMHPHGVTYTPDNDGGWFAAEPRPGTIIEVGGSYTYEWQVRPTQWVHGFITIIRFQLDQICLWNMAQR